MNNLDPKSNYKIDSQFGRPVMGTGEKENFIMCQEYYDFIEFLQNKFSFDEVYDWQEEFGGSFTRPEELTPKPETV